MDRPLPAPNLPLNLDSGHPTPPPDTGFRWEAFPTDPAGSFGAMSFSSLMAMPPLPGFTMPPVPNLSQSSLDLPSQITHDTPMVPLAPVRLMSPSPQEAEPASASNAGTHKTNRRHRRRDRATYTTRAMQTEPETLERPLCTTSLALHPPPSTLARGNDRGAALEELIQAVMPLASHLGVLVPACYTSNQPKPDFTAVNRIADGELLESFLEFPVLPPPEERTARWANSVRAIYASVVHALADADLTREELEKKTGFQRRRLSSALSPVLALGLIIEVREGDVIRLRRSKRLEGLCYNASDFIRHAGFSSGRLSAICQSLSYHPQCLLKLLPAHNEFFPCDEAPATIEEAAERLVVLGEGAWQDPLPRYFFSEAELAEMGGASAIGSATTEPVSTLPRRPRRASATAARSRMRRVLGRKGATPATAAG